MNKNNGPLAGIRILDLSRVVAGPFGSMRLADMGAEVIKIENPDGGDDSRQLRPPEAGGEAFYYLAYNRGKRSVAVDMSTPEGKDLIRRLARESDVLLENFRPGVTKRLGLDWESLKADCPRLVYCSISAYGQTGSMSDRGGFDPVLQAESGMMSFTGEAGQGPLRHPLSIIDTLTSHYATEAILAALIARGRTGAGQHIDISMLDCSVASLSNAAQLYLVSGQNPPKTGNRHQSAVPVGLFETESGPFYMALGYEKLWRKLCTEVLERPDLLDDPRFLDNPARGANRDAVYDILNAAFASGTREHWLAKLRKAGLPAGAVRTVSETLESPEVAERGMVTTVDHPTAGPLKLVGSPFRFSATPTVPPAPPPLLGQDTDAVLHEVLGMDAAAVAALKAAGAVK